MIVVLVMSTHNAARKIVSDRANDTFIYEMNILCIEIDFYNTKNNLGLRSHSLYSFSFSWMVPLPLSERESRFSFRNW